MPSDAGEPRTQGEVRAGPGEIDPTGAPEDVALTAADALAPAGAKDKTRRAEPEPSRGGVAAGTLLITVARVVFFGCGYLLHILLARYLEPGLYGIWGLLLGVLQISRVLVSSGPGRAVSIFTAREPRTAAAVRRQGLKVQAVLVAVLCVALVPGAPLVGRVFGDTSLTPYIRITGAFVPFFGLYALYLGTLNGMRAFARQAALMTSYSVLRMMGVVTFLFLGYKVFGALGGAWLALLATVAVGRHLVGRLPDEGRIGWRPVAVFAFHAGLFAIALSAFQNLDIFMLKALSGRDEQVGFYTAGRILAQLPRALLFGLNATMLPAVSRSLRESRHGKTERYVKGASRYCIIALAPMALIGAATANELIAAIYTARYAPSAHVLRILVFGYALLTIFSLGATILMALGRAALAMTLAFVMAGLSAALNRSLIPAYGLEGAAVATSITALVGAAAVWGYLARRFGAPLGILTAVRVAGAAVLVAGAARALRFTGGWLIAEYLFLGGTYIALLVVSREITGDDWRVLRRVVKRSPSGRRGPE